MIEYKNNKVYDSVKKDKNFIDIAPVLERNLISIIPDKDNEFLKIALVA